MSQPTTRVAPTPSGFLHAGNAVNILLTQWWARAHDARLVLRIDDFDTGRARPEYLRDVFTTLAWLGVRVDEGPRDPEEFRAHWSMGLRRDAFLDARDRLLSEHPARVFVCCCSRTQLDGEGRCVAGCRTAGRSVRPGSSVVRLAVAPGTTVRVGGRTVPVPPGDHVLWRRDDLPAYHLGSVVADEQIGVTAVVRGVDLLAASALQVHLADLLPAPAFAAAELLHHTLLTDPAGRKLSKSAGARATPPDRDPGLRRQVQAWAEQIAVEVGIRP